ncbi:hypothetical protein KB559_02005 [Paenibacillus sp. Marseille-P2973]|uniref:hypothetical protein n=1 Tax=Paenibacillus sp. Marseille-P2973 TaxID=1871032 RepID=UPI001B39CD34|nr:hypothetical protein [Paenibacillus sp. Marseille-P2973]MBQ4897612.1 hypothetical protein [Paenibacillus sp. Marseille-P2973]
MRKPIIGLLLLVCMAFGLGGCFNPGGSSEEFAVVVKEMDAQNPQFSFGNGEEAYRMGYNKKDMPVFVDTDKAFKQFTKDYKDAIDAVEQQFDLSSISKTNWKPYFTYGWQLITDDEALRKQASEISAFFDYYENSFKKSY